MDVVNQEIHWAKALDMHYIENILRVGKGYLDQEFAYEQVILHNTIHVAAIKYTLIEQEHDMSIKELVYISPMYYIRRRQLY